jgi:hypothetical protein
LEKYYPALAGLEIFSKTGGIDLDVRWGENTFVIGFIYFSSS